MVFASKVFTTKNKEWNELVDRACADVYFSSGYHKVYEESYFDEINDAFVGEAFLFFYGDEDNFVLFPFVKKRIELPYVDSGEYYDLSTVYGYSGPVVKCSSPELRKELVKEFLDSLTKYCVENKIVSGFIRFHPVANNYADFKEEVNLIDERETVFVNLEKDSDDLFGELNKKTRNQIRNAEKKGVEVYRSEDVEDLKEFVRLYLERMEFVKTSKRYLFPFEFYKNTVEMLEDKSSLFVAKYNGKVIASSLFIHYGPFAHYHFSGSDYNYWNLSPANLILWKAILYLKDKRFKKLHLGGGNSPGDSLFHFKSGFSKDRSMFRGAGWIFDKEVYDKFVGLRKEFCKENKIEFGDKFFPAYRGYLPA